MNGVAAVLAALSGNATLTAQVPAVRITAGVAAAPAALPYISVTSVSATDLNIPSPAAKRMVRELVQVTILAPDYPAQKRIHALVRKAAADRLDLTVTGISSVTIHTQGAGPDFMDDEAAIYIGTQDFIVIYNEDR